MRHLLMSLVLSMFSAYPSWAAQIEMSRGELCDIADFVVLGEVTSGETRWTSHATEGAIERLRWVRVQDAVRGKVDGTLEVVLPGGTMGELTHWVEDVPELLTNASYLLFLHETEGGLQIIGGNQGAVRLVDDGQRGETPTEALESVEVCRAR